MIIKPHFDSLYDCSAIWRKFISDRDPVAATIPVKCPSRFYNNTCGWSNSSASPLLSTKIRSDSIIVSNRWATVSTVQSLNFCFMVCWINESVSISTLAVASSNTNILFFLKIARARQISCFCPTENTDVPSEIGYLSPLSIDSIASFNCTSSSESHIAWSE